MLMVFGKELLLRLIVSTNGEYGVRPLPHPTDSFLVTYRIQSWLRILWRSRDFCWFATISD
jgi:hypothetical protein